MNKQPEYELQKAVAQYLDLQYPNVLYCASAGGMRTSMKQAVKMKATGYKKGFPDLFIYEPRCSKYILSPGLSPVTFHGLAIELKVKGNYPSKEQKEWRSTLIERGYYASVCTGFDEARNTIDHYMNLLS